MNGKIYFDDAHQLSFFLKAFTGSTAIFEVHFQNNQYVLEFTGGF
jgi:hypothetical protein